LDERNPKMMIMKDKSINKRLVRFIVFLIVVKYPNLKMLRLMKRRRMMKKVSH